MSEWSGSHWQRWGVLRQFKLNLIRLARLKSSPDAIARGVALGIFVGFSPFFGFHIVIVLVLAFLLRQNKIAAFGGVWITNPLTAPLIYALEYEVGRMLLGLPTLGFYSFAQEMSWDLIKQIGAPLFLGSFVLGLPVAVISYALTIRLIPGLRQYKIQRWPRKLRKLLPLEMKDDLK